MLFIASTNSSSDLATILLGVAGALIALVATYIGFRASRAASRFEFGGTTISLGTTLSREVTAELNESAQESLSEAVSRLSAVDQDGKRAALDGQELAELARDVRRVLAEGQRLRTAVDERTETLLKEYHDQGLGQSRYAFLFSVVFASLGFVLIAATVIVAVTTGTHTGANAVAIISGAIVEAVSGLFFVQGNKTRIVMTTFFDKLRQDRSLEEALRLSDAIPDPLIKSRLKTVLSLRLANAAASDEVIRTVMKADVADIGQGEPSRSSFTSSIQTIPSLSDVEPRAGT